MDRRSMRYGYLTVTLVVLAALAAAGGCRSAFTALAYLTHGSDVAPDFAGLKDKKVIIVCRPLVSLQYRDAGVTRDLTQQIGQLLQQRVPKIKVIDAQKVVAWCDEHTWEEFPEVGKALKADMVVGIDLTSFSVYKNQTLYQGHADVAVKVYDLSKNGGTEQMVFEKTLPQSVYPPNVPIPVSEKAEADFRHEFVAVLADQIGRYFYSHDPYADIGLDNAGNQ